MTQLAIVVNSLEDGNAVVAVTRKTACGGNCENCESCVVQSELTVSAANPLQAKKGDKVLIETGSSRIYKALALVYIIPLILLFAAYFAASALGRSEGLCILSSFIGLCLGGVIIFLSRNRYKNNPISYEIIEILQ